MSLRYAGQSELLAGLGAIVLARYFIDGMPQTRCICLGQDSEAIVIRVVSQPRTLSSTEYRRIEAGNNYTIYIVDCLHLSPNIAWRGNQLLPLISYIMP